MSAADSACPQTTARAWPGSPLNAAGARARVGVMADTGTTYNSSATYQHMVSHNPDFAMFIGDLTYADTWTSVGVQGGSIPTPFYALTSVRQSQTFQPRWCAAGP